MSWRSRIFDLIILKLSYDRLKLVVFPILALIFHFKNDLATTFNEIDQRNTPNFKVSRLATKFGYVKLFSGDDFIILWRHEVGTSQKTAFYVIFFIFCIFNPT